MSASSASLESAKLIWRDDKTPESKIFGDIYFSPQDGHAESRYVFLEGIGGAEFWQNKNYLTIGETGFGTGLNFLTLWQEWDKTSDSNRRLHFLSVEAYPLNKEEIRKALSVWPGLSKYAEKLLEAYPEIHPGIHRIVLDKGRVRLTLLFGMAEEILPQVEGKVDGWFLDGFSPAQNQSMWTDVVYKQLARLSKPKTKLATFTAAGHVRRGLEEVGFTITKRKGFGRKRECLQAAFTEVFPINHWQDMPWFNPATPLKEYSKVAIIGGGIAGISLAQNLLSRGFDPVVFEAAPKAASVGSGNLVGLVQPRLTAADSLDGRFNASAFLYAVRYYTGENFTGESIWLNKRGVLQLARSSEEDYRFQRLVEETRLPEKTMHYVTADKASEIANCPIAQNALYFPTAGCISPKQFVQTSAGKLKAQNRIHYETVINGLEKTEDGWLISGDQLGRDYISEKFDAIILANGPYADQLWTDWDVPLHAKRGQVIHLSPTLESEKLNCSLAFDGYLSPALQIDESTCCHVAGASYANFKQNPSVEEKGESADWRDLRAEDYDEILQAIQQDLPDLNLSATLKNRRGRAGLRATVPDHLAILGALPDKDYFDQTYDDLHHGKKAARYPVGKYHDGLYCLTGLGSRGVQTSPLLAEALVDLITGEPCALDRDTLAALHPARFQIRRLKKPPHLRDK